MNPRLAWPAVSLAGVGMLVAGTMAVTGIDPQTIALIVSLMVVPVLASLIAGQMAEVKGATTAVQQQTNGHNARLLDILEAQGQLLAAMPPAPPSPAPGNGPSDPPAS